MIKNRLGQYIGVQMVNASTNAAFTGSVSCYVTVDDEAQSGAFTTTHKGNGYHRYSPTQAQTNASVVAFTFTGTGAKPETVFVVPTTTTDSITIAQLKEQVRRLAIKIEQGLKKAK